LTTLFFLLSFSVSMIATDGANMFAFPRSFSWVLLQVYCSCCSACYFVDERNILWFIWIFFSFSSLLSFSFSLFHPFAILCSNNSSSSATITTITINYKMIKSSRPMRIASFFPSSSFFFSLFFLSDDRSCGEAFYSSIGSFIYMYIYIYLNIYIQNDIECTFLHVFLSIIHFSNDLVVQLNIFGHGYCWK
jgi:hypothetical protein